MKDDGEFSSHGNFSFAIAAAPRDAQSPTLQSGELRDPCQERVGSLK